MGLIDAGGSGSRWQNVASMGGGGDSSVEKRWRGKERERKKKEKLGERLREKGKQNVMPLHFYL